MQLTMRGFYGTHPAYPGSCKLQLCMDLSYFWKGLTPPNSPLFRTLLSALELYVVNHSRRFMSEYQVFNNKNLLNLLHFVQL